MSIEKTSKVDVVLIQQPEVQAGQNDAKVEINLIGNRQTLQNQMALMEHFGSSSLKNQILEMTKKQIESMTPEQREKFEAEREKIAKMSSEEQKEYFKSLIDAVDTKIKKDNSLYTQWKNGWKEDFKDVDGVGSFLKAVVNRTRNGFRVLDQVNPLYWIKKPIQAGAEKVDDMFENCDSTSVTVKTWEMVKGAGDVFDYLTTVEGLWLMAATAVGLEAIGIGAEVVAGTKGAICTRAAINGGFGVAGAVESGSGIKGIIQAETKEDARIASRKLAGGAIMLAGSYKMSKNMAKALRKKISAGIEPKIIKDMSFTELKASVEKVFDAAFDEMGVPKEARPKLKIVDDIHYKTTSEIESMVLEKVNRHISWGEEPIKELKIFEKGDNPRTMSNEEIIAKIKTAVEKHPKARLYDYQYHDFKSSNRNGEGGSYNANVHTINFAGKAYRNNTFKTIEEVMVHEAEHCRNAVLRHRLTTEESSQIIKDLLTDRIINGEPEQIIVKGGILGPEMMSVPKMSAKFRAEFSKFAQEKLYTEKAQEYAQDIKEIELYKYNIKENNIEYVNKYYTEYEAAVKNLSEINQGIEKLIAENPDFVAENGGTAESATKVLTKYVQSHLTRYTFGSNNKIPALKKVELPELTPAERSEAIESLRGYVETIEGNAAISGIKRLFGLSKSEFNQYQFSYEEVKARNAAAKYEKSQLEIQPKSKENKARIEVLDFELKYNELGSKMYEKYSKVVNNPNDAGLKAELEAVCKEFDVLDAQRNKYRKSGTKMDYSVEFNFGYSNLLYGSVFAPLAIDN